MNKTERFNRYLQIGFRMAKEPDWDHIEGPFYRHNGDLYDLTNANLDKLEKVKNNTQFLVQKGVFK